MGKRDLITKDFALYVVHYFASMQTWSKNEILSEIDRTIKEAKEDIVRCKDCKYAYINSFSAASGVALCRKLSNEAETAIRQQDDYCSYGERKEE
jgi:hypothetical protein